MLILTHRKELLPKIHLKNTFFKLMSNGVFRKTMENIRNKVDVKLITNKKKDD